jgi:hypothetical protein
MLANSIERQDMYCRWVDSTHVRSWRRVRCQQGREIRRKGAVQFQRKERSWYRPEVTKEEQKRLLHEKKQLAQLKRKEMGMGEAKGGMEWN